MYIGIEYTHPIVHGDKESCEALGLSKVRVESLIKGKEDTLSNLIIWGQIQ